MKIRKELWFGFSLMALIGAGALYMLLSADKITNGHIGLLMLSLVVVAIILLVYIVSLLQLLYQQTMSIKMCWCDDR